MRRALVALSVGIALLAIPAVPAGAQQANRPAFCAARVQAEAAHGRRETTTALNLMGLTAPVAAVATAVKDLTALFDQKGNKAFESAKGAALIKTIDDDVFANCGFTKLDVTASDYRYQGLPATVPAGNVALRLTNTAPKELHELLVFKLLPTATTTDPLKLLALPRKKFRQQAEPEPRQAAFAPPGQTSISVGRLDAGKYVVACMIHVGNKPKGAPHYTQGMYASFEVR